MMYLIRAFRIGRSSSGDDFDILLHHVEINVSGTFSKITVERGELEHSNGFLNANLVNLFWILHKSICMLSFKCVWLRKGDLMYYYYHGIRSLTYVAQNLSVIIFVPASIKVQNTLTLLAVPVCCCSVDWIGWERGRSTTTQRRRNM